MTANEKYFLKLSKKVSIDRIPVKSDVSGNTDGGSGFFYTENRKNECFITAYRFTAEKDLDMIFITEDEMKGIYSDKELFFAITDKSGKVIFKNTGKQIAIDLKCPLKKGDELYMVTLCADETKAVIDYDFELLITDKNGNAEEVFVTEPALLKNSSWANVPADRVDLLFDYSDYVENGRLVATALSFADNDGNIDNFIFKSLMLTAADNGATLFIPQNTYILSAEEDSPYAIDMSFYKLKGLHIDANGSKIMLSDNFKGGLCFIGSRDILIENLYLDYIDFPWIQGTVVEADAETQTVKLLLDDDYNVFDDPRFHETIGAHYGTVRDLENPRFLDKDALYYFFMSEVSKLGDRLYSVKLAEFTPLVGYSMHKDDKLVINNRVGCNMSMFDIRESGNFTLRNITIYSCACTGVVGSQMVGPVKIENFKMTYRPESNQWITSNADGIHIQAGTHPITIENSDFIGLIDDGVNFYQWRTLTESVMSEDYIRINTDGGCMPRMNDTLEFYDSVEMKFLGAANVIGIDNTEGFGPHRFANIKLDKKIKGIKAAEGDTPATYIYIQQQDMAGSVIRNCTFANLRGRGLVLHSADTLVENNRFINISNHGVHGWYGYEEGLRVRGLTVRNNYFNRVGYYNIEANQDSAGVISIRLDNNAATEQSKHLFHENVVIENNVIEDFHSVAINLGNCLNATVSGNKITSNIAVDRYTKERGIVLSHSENVKLQNNLLDNAIGDTFTPLTVYDCNNTLSENNLYFAKGIKKEL